MTDRGVEWRFGESDEDAAAWFRSPSVLHVYVDFRLPDTPPRSWHRVIAVTHGWVRAQLVDPSASHSWPAALVVPDGTLPEMRLAIDGLLSQGGARIVAREAKLISELDRASPS
jgi:hypothetical protein